MLQEMKNHVDNSITPLVGGILEDTQQLIRQEIALAKSEARLELAKLKAAAISGGAAVALSLLSLVLLSFTIVHLLAWAVPDLPLWASYGIVALLLGTIAYLLFNVVTKKMKDVNFIPPQTAETLKDMING